MNKLQKRIKDLEAISDDDIEASVKAHCVIKGIKFAQEEILKMIDEWYDNRKSVIFDVDELKKQIKGGN